MIHRSKKLNLFFSELKRRKVSRLISVYAVIGCGVIGTIDIIGGRFLLPDWTVRFVIGSVIGGFPVALILGWLFDITSEGIKRTINLTEDEKASIPQASFKLNWVSITVLSIIVFFLFTFFTIPRPNMMGFKGKDWILVTDLNNNTKDSIFDLSLKQALIITIDQSKYVSVYPKGQIDKVLQRMGMPNNTKIDTKLGLEIAERENIKVVLTLSISELGGSYILSTRILNPNNEEAIISRQTNAKEKNDILEALNKLANRLRKDLGESLLSISSNEVPLIKATTKSLEALRSYSLADYVHANRGLDEAEVLYLEAIDLDPEFALAHAGLGALYYWKNERDKGDYHFEVALNLLDRLTEKEKLLIQAKVEEIRGNRVVAINRWNSYLKKYPNFTATWFRLGYNYMMLSRFEEAVEAFNESLRLGSNKDAATYINLASCYSQMKMYNESIENYLIAFDLNPDWIMVSNMNHEFGFTYVESGKIEKATEVFEKMIEGDDAQKAQGYRSIALLHMCRGEYKTAIDVMKKSISLYETLGYELSEFRNRTFLATMYKDKGMLDAFNVELDRAKKLLLSTSSGPSWFRYLGLLYVRNGELEEAENLLIELSKRVNEGKREDEAALYQLKGEIEFAKGNNIEALNLLKKANLLWNNSYTLESLANYFNSTNEIDNAISTYEDIINTKYLLGWEGQRPSIFSYYFLGKLYTNKGDTIQAIECLNQFLNILDKADKDLPVFIDARSRLKKLMSLNSEDN